MYHAIHDTDVLFDLICCVAFWLYAAWQLYRYDRRRNGTTRRR